MTAQITPFKVTPDDLPDLDKKTRDGLAPLLDALNVSIQQLVNAQGLRASEQVVKSNFNSDSGGSAYVDIKPTLPQPVTSVSLGWFQRDDRQPMTSVYSFSTTALDSGLVRLYFVGLDVSSKYNFTVTLK
jgi:hypothetical protein